MAKVVALGATCEMCNIPGKTHRVDDEGKSIMVVPMRNVVPMKTIRGEDVYGYICDKCLGVDPEPELELEPELSLLLPVEEP